VGDEYNAIMSYRTKCEEDLLKAARKYARMKLYGASVADGHVILCCREEEMMLKNSLDRFSWFYLYLIILLLVSPAAFAQSELDLSAGTVALGGSASITGVIAIPEDGNSESGGILTISPRIGYFLLDGFAISGGFDIAIGLGDLYEDYTTNLSFGLNLDYYFDASVRPYLGIGFGMSFLIPDEGDTLKTLDLGLRMGLLIPCNQHVAVDIGVRGIFSFILNDFGGTLVQIPVGYLGVQGFF